MKKLRWLAVGGLICLLVAVASTARAETLVGDVFLNGYDGWTDMFPSGETHGGGLPNWGIVLTDDKCLSESSDGRITTSSTKGDGRVKGYNLVNTAQTPEGGYHVKATLQTWDDDGFGLLFGYTDENNFFRVSFRGQANGNLGYACGTTVQKMVAGTLYEPAAWKSTAFAPPDVVTPSNVTPFDVDVYVNGSTWTVSVDSGSGMTQILTGGENDDTSAAESNLLGTGRLYGVHSWYQRVDSDTTLTCRGTELLGMTITDASDSVVRTHAFDSPVAWRGVMMTNAKGNQGAGTDDRGEFRLNFRNGTITDGSNGYEWATSSAANVDFIGPGAVIDEAGSADWTDYELKVRMSTADDDGIGLLLRTQSDNTFYRVNFASQSMTATNAYERCPQGMSIQKCLDGVWSELFRDDQSSPLFVFTPGTAFDVAVQAIGDTITVQVINDPDGAATVIDYAPVVDASSPILSGTVGLTNWGCGGVDLPAVFAPYGGVGSGAPLLTVVPEPSSLVLLGLLGLVPLALRRRR